MRNLRLLGVLSLALLVPSCKHEPTPPPANPSVPTAAQSSGQITVHVDQPGAKISPMLYGLMTEEINHSYDGGLYAELIQNRIFEDNADEPVHWSVRRSTGAAGEIAIDQHDPVNTGALNRSLRLDITDAREGGRVGIANDGYWGIPVWPHTRYRASFYARASKDFSGPLTADIESDDGETTFASATLPKISTEWKKYTLWLSTGDVKMGQQNRFVISAKNRGSVWFSLVSLFPPTFNHRPNGNRIDLMKILGDMNPAFLRLPGGNYLEGDEINERFNWYKTIGPLEDRPGHQGPWGYRSSDGMGMLEFLEWCQDLHMEPVLGVYAGYSLRGAHIEPGENLKPYVQEDMDEIEYIVGDQSTKWGRERAKDGHAKPFPLHYIEIGNEDWFDRSGTYPARFAQIYDAIKAKYPQMQIISTAPVHSRTPDIVDDHYYHPARWFESNVHHYDNYPRTGPKIFVGEWATQEGSPTPDMNAALSDAAWMTGMERNADVVVMASYAPLLVNVSKGGRQWGTNLIGYDATTSFGSPSYYAQQMFMKNRGDVVLPVDLQIPQEQNAKPIPPTGGIGISTWGTQAEFKDIKVENGDNTLFQSDFSNGLHGWHRRTRTWNIQDGVLKQTANDRPDQINIGEASWGDYTYSLKARKISGAEGFIILFHCQDRHNFIAWNLGGWDNSRSAIMQTTDDQDTQLGDSANVTIEPNKWYDIRIECHGLDIKCYLDNQLITEATAAPMAPVSSIFACASRDKGNGDVILKVVNAGAEPQSLGVDLQGVAKVGTRASAELLTGQPTEINTIEDPKHVAPLRAEIDDASNHFIHEFPAYSVTVVRLKTR